MKKNSIQIIALVLIPFYLIAIAVLAYLDIQTVFEPPYLLLTLNSLFLGLIPIFIAWLAANSYLKRGQPGILWLGCGMLVFCLGSVGAGLLILLPEGANIAVTVFNACVLFSSLFHVIAASYFLTGPTTTINQTKKNIIWSVICYAGTIIGIVLLSYAAVLKLTPLFFIQGSGPTIIRQVVLGTAVLFYVFSSSVFLNLYFKSKADFLYWYFISMNIIAIGLFSVFLGKAVGSPIIWVGRSAQYLGCLITLLAMISVFRRSAKSKESIEEVINSFFSEAETGYKNLVETANDAIISYDHSGRIILWNTTAQKMFGYSSQEAIGLLFYRTIFPEPYFDVKEKFEQRMIAMAGTPSGELSQVEVKRKDGSLFSSEISLSIQKLQSGRVVTMILRDITERKQAQQALQEYSNRLEMMVMERTKELQDTQEQLLRKEKLALVGQMAGGVAHELRNPLSVISGAVYYLNLINPNPDESTREYLDLLSTEVHNTERIITNMSDFSHTREAIREPYNISILIGQLISKYPAPAGVEVIINIPPGCPNAFIDPLQLEQVFSNLMINAFQAMPEGGKLAIEGRFIHSSEDREELSASNGIAISFTDTGCGIPVENMNKLFDPLFTTKLRGIGLGLAICKNLVEANKGIIGFESKVGIGSIFTVYLPVIE